MKRLVLAILLAVSPLADAQAQPVPLRAQCFPLEPLIADLQAGGATMQDVFTDSDGDHWLVIERRDGGGFIGWISRERSLFCVVSGRPPRQQGNQVPQRGA